MRLGSKQVPNRKELLVPVDFIRHDAVKGLPHALLFAQVAGILCEFVGIFRTGRRVHQVGLHEVHHVNDERGHTGRERRRHRRPVPGLQLGRPLRARVEVVDDLVAREEIIDIGVIFRRPVTVPIRIGRANPKCRVLAVAVRQHVVDLVLDVVRGRAEHQDALVLGTSYGVLELLGPFRVLVASVV